MLEWGVLSPNNPTDVFREGCASKATLRAAPCQPVPTIAELPRKPAAALNSWTCKGDGCVPQDVTKSSLYQLIVSSHCFF